MMLSNAEFFSNFAKEASFLRNLTKANKKLTWLKEHGYAFKNLISKFRKRLLVSYFDMNKQTFIFTHVPQGQDIESAQPIVTASRTTNTAEKRYPQIDFEAHGINFAL